MAKRGTLAIDVGANLGYYALGLSRAVGSKGLVIALEPNPVVYRELLNVTWGSRVVALNLGASDKPGPMSLTVPVDANGVANALEAFVGERDLPRGGEPVHVRLVRLDEIVPANLPVSVIKIDVEGHEAQVLAGAKDVLAEYHPALVIEIEARHLSNSASVEDVVEPLLEAGYKCQCIGRGNRLFPWSDFDLEADQLRFLTPSGNVQDKNIPLYCNNFVFT
ncbi:MAG TPA: FkbM family methyltransferase [Acidimicrobiales bacterium]|nr:FkbM family methyltransferase [Acidimicrobiales bacterium]